MGRRAILRLTRRVIKFILKPTHTKPGTGSKSEAIGIAVDTTTLLLTVARDASKFVPLPLVQNVAGLALSIIAIIQGAHENRGAFQSLAEDTCNLVSAIVLQTHDSSDKDAESKISTELHVNLEALKMTLQKIEDFATKKVKNNMLLRIIQHASDLRVIQDFRIALRQSLDLFGLKSNITIQENLAALSMQQDALLKEMREYMSKAQGAAPDSCLLESQDTSMLFPHITSSDGIFDITAIGKDQNNIDSSHHIISTNSNNNITTVMTNTGNDLSARLCSDGKYSKNPTVMIASTTDESDSSIKYVPEGLKKASLVELDRKPRRERQDEALNQTWLNHATSAAAVQETLNTPFPKTPSRNPFHHSHASKNPFAQSSKDSMSCSPHFHPHHFRSTSDPSQSSIFQSSSQGMPIPNFQHSKHSRMFPTIQSSSGQFNITHIGGDQNLVDSSCHIISSNSGNTSITTTTNSNNDSSIVKMELP